MRRRIVCGLGVLAACAAVAGCGVGGSGGSTSAGATATGATTTGVTATPAVTLTRTAAAPKLIEAAFRSGAVVTGGGRHEVSVGDRVVISVTSDVADEVHLHGYDKKADVEAGGTVRLPFTASIPGIFEVELESRAFKLFDLVVR